VGTITMDKLKMHSPNPVSVKIVVARHS